MATATVTAEDVGALKAVFDLAQSLGIATVQTASTNLPVQGTGAMGFVAFPTGTPRTVTPDFTNRLWDLYHLCIQAGVTAVS